MNGSGYAFCATTGSALLICRLTSAHIGTHHLVSFHIVGYRRRSLPIKPTHVDSQQTFATKHHNILTEARHIHQSTTTYNSKDQRSTMALALWSSRILTGAASRNSKCWTPWSSSSARSSIGSIRCFEILIDPKALSAATSNKKAKSKHNKNGGSGSGSKRPSYRFVDKTRVRVVGGHGGKGCLSQQQMRRKHKLRPDGGHGGNGGSVIIVADPYEQSLRWSQPHLQAEKGSNGMSQGMSGRNGKNLIVRVPCGVVVKKIVLPGDELYDYTKVLDEEENTSTQGNWGDDEDYDDNTNNNSLDNWNIDRDEENNAGVEFFAIDEEGNPLLDDVDESSNGNEKRNNSDSNENTTENPTNGYDFDVDDEQYYSPQERRRLEQKVSLADLDKPGANIMVARGGRGGYGSIIYASVHGPLPDAHILIDNAKSQPSEVTYLELELKLIADIGTIGFPNAGTLIL